MIARNPAASVSAGSCVQPAKMIWSSLPACSAMAAMIRSEEHTSELQSLMRISYAVFCLKKKTTHPYLAISHTQPPNSILTNMENYERTTHKIITNHTTHTYTQR